MGIWLRVSRKNNNQNVAAEYEIIVAHAAPTNPYRGMKRRLRSMFNTIPMIVLYIEYLTKFSAIKYWLLATPKKVAMPDQT